MASLSIVIPCYNEAHTVRQLLKKVFDVSLPGWSKEVIIVDDASLDGTRDIVREYRNRATVLFQERNQGKGSTVKRALAAATGDYVIIQDADLEYDPGDIPALLSVLESGVADVVYGSRTLDPHARHGGLIARVGAWFITKLINTLYGLSLTDAWTCYKVFPRAASDAFTAGRFESELLFTAALARRQYRFAEVPISYAPRAVADGKKIRYRDGLYAIIAICIDRIRHL